MTEDLLFPDAIRSFGVSGTRETMTSVQEHAFFDLMLRAIRAGATELHHGACTGADQFAHWHMTEHRIITHVHPPVDKKYSAETFLLRHVLRVDYEAKPYGERNQDIVDASDVLLIAPLFPENDPKSKRSGTWMTARMADAAGKLVLVADSEGKQSKYVATRPRTAKQSLTEGS